ncbi:MAG: septum formation initiator family protein [Treponema sp.]|nr:septum formation initiator family protein [Treponema sp.]
MIHLKLLASALAGTVVYVTVSVFAGQNGINSYKQLENQKREISKQATMIQNINEELILEKNALSNDRDVIAAFARKLDYVKEGETLVKITGLKPFEHTLYDTGTVLRRKEVSYIPDDVCKLLGVVFFFMTLLLFLFIDLSNGNNPFERKKKIKIVTGIPIYGGKQI